MNSPFSYVGKGVRARPLFATRILSDSFTRPSPGMRKNLQCGPYRERLRRDERVEAAFLAAVLRERRVR